MSANVRQTPQERVCGPIRAGHEQDTTSDGTGPQNGPEGTGDMESLRAMRAYVENHDRMDEFTRCTLRVYAKEIGREVEELRDRDYRNGREDAEGAVEFADRLCRASERREDVTLWGVDYTPLPVDADGVPIHVGDVMDNTHKDGFRAKRVTGIAYHENGRTTIEVDEDRLRWHNADKLCHHHAPTVEDVLAEFAERLDEIGSEDDCVGEAEQECRACIRRDIAAAYAEYAAKLRLAGDE